MDKEDVINIQAEAFINDACDKYSFFFSVERDANGQYLTNLFIEMFNCESNRIFVTCSKTNFHLIHKL